MRKSEHLRCYQPEIAIGYDWTMMVQLLAVIRSGMSALIIVPMNNDNFLIFRVAGSDVTGSADFFIASLRRCWRIIDHHIMYEPDSQIVKYVCKIH